MINNIQALRAFACASVVLFHAIVTSESYSNNVYFLKYLHGYGASGVDVFFVISGFVMLHSQFFRRQSPQMFIANRIVRIVPIYWIMTIFVSSLYLFIPHSFREMVITPTWLISSLFFVSTVTTSHYPIVYPGWTLEWEMAFYMIFAVGLYFKNIKNIFWFLLILVSGYSVFTGFWIGMEFVLGLAAAIFYNTKKIKPFLAGVIIIFGFLYSFIFIPEQLASIDLNRFIFWGLPSFLVVFGCLYVKQITNRFILYIGSASYSIYIIQILTIPTFYKITKHFNFLNSDLSAILCLIITVFLGCLFYAIIERPITFFLKNRLRSIG